MNRMRSSSSDPFQTSINDQMEMEDDDNGHDSHGDESREYMEFGHSTYCYSLVMQSVIRYFFEHKKRLYGVALAFAFMFVLFLIAILFLSFYNPNSNDQETEKLFAETVSAAEIRRKLRFLSSVPHIAGSDADHKNAVYFRDKLREYGIQAEIESVPVLVNRPLSRLVEVVSPANHQFVASLTEPALPEDPSSSDPNIVPTFNGFSASGDVHAELVYVNYGRPEDYALLEEQGVSVMDKIVIARYGKGFRGNKAKLAEEKGALGLLLYSDPQDDGYTKGPVFPQGPWRPAQSAQRGSVWLGQGDPQTPGWPSTENGPRLSLDELRNASSSYMKGYATLPKIPVQPLSWADALPFLSALKGAIPASSWQGGLNITYHVGPGPAIVHMKLEMEFVTTEIWNVIGRIEGSIEPDRLVIVGNHRDAWVFGAGDPHGGTSVLLEIARSLGACHRAGWTPRRTILFTSWDGEEYGLLGSVEFVERHAALLRAQTVAYINVDFGVKGTHKLLAKGTPNLQELLSEVTHFVSMPKPTDNRKVSDVWPDHKLEPLGATSDFMGFIQKLGIASLDLRFVDDSPLIGVYHSRYDSFNWVEKFLDPTFEYHATLAKVLGLLLLRLSDSPLLPLNYSPYAHLLGEAVELIGSALPTEANLSESYTRLKESVSHLSSDVSQLHSQIAQQTSHILQDPYGLRNVNDRLMMGERGFIAETGTWAALKCATSSLPHHLTTSGAVLLPSIRHAVKSKNWPEAAFQMQRAAQLVESVREILLGGLHL